MRRQSVRLRLLISVVSVLLIVSCVKKIDWKLAPKDSLIQSLNKELYEDLNECEADLDEAESDLADVEYHLQQCLQR